MRIHRCFFGLLFRVEACRGPQVQIKRQTSGLELKDLHTHLERRTTTKDIIKSEPPKSLKHTNVQVQNIATLELRLCCPVKISSFLLLEVERHDLPQSFEMPGSNYNWCIPRACRTNVASTWKLAVKGCMYRVGKPISLPEVWHKFGVSYELLKVP